MSQVASSNDYESQRAQRIASNRHKLLDLGLSPSKGGGCLRDPDLQYFSEIDTHASQLSSDTTFFSTPPKRRKKRVVRSPKKSPEDLTPSRLSKRIRGEKPEFVEPKSLTPVLELTDSARKLYTKKGRPRLQLVLPQHPIKAPLTLRSIGVTVLDLGQIHRGQWKNKYWSSTGCLFHHAYPVGYKATKCHFNKRFTMWIEAGEYGPLFVVREEGSGLIFKGESPTKPWTKVCLHKKLGTRISGPQFFGFSDPCTQSAIAAMYNEAELEAAMEGSKAWNEILSPEERAAKEFMEIEGIGETTAMVLACTTALGGSKHKNRTDLAKWASIDQGEKLKHFLLHSTELPTSLLRWPAWHAKFVPRIVEDLVHRK